MTWITLRVSDFTPDGTAFDLIGPKDAPCLLLIHGLGLSRRLWDQHVEALSDYRLLKYDLYGHGESSPAPRVADLALFAEQIDSLMAYANVDSAHVIGFSIGGMINRKLVMDFPERVDSLVIMNSPHNRGEVAQIEVESRARLVREQGIFSTFDAALKRWFTPNYLLKGVGPRLVRDWREDVDPESYAQTAWILAHGVRELIAPVPPINVLAHVLTCENDSGSTPEMSHEIAAEIKGATIQIVPRLQHLGLIEQPKIFTDAIVGHIARVSQCQQS